MATLLDTFTGTGSLDAHTMDTGPGWTETHGDWSITAADKASGPTSLGSTALATVDASAADGTLVVDVDVPSANDFEGGTVVRFSDSNNYWLCTVRRGTGADPFILITRKVAGTLDDTSFSFVSTTVLGTTKTMTVTLSGSSLSLTLDGTTISNSTATHNQTATLLGLSNLSVGGSPAMLFDNFQFDAASTGGGGGASAVRLRLRPLFGVG